MYKLNNESMTNFEHGLEVAFGAAQETVHFYKPDVLANASRPSDAMAAAAPLPVAANEVYTPFIPAVANG